MLHKDQLQFCFHEFLKFMLFMVQVKPQHNKIMVGLISFQAVRPSDK